MTRRHPDAKPPFRQPDRPAGERPRCRWCWGPVPKGRHSWCSDHCVDEYKNEYDWLHISRQVFKRDRGVCAICGCDTERVRRVLRHARWRSWWEWDVRRELFGTKRGGDRLYEIDHICQRKEGGTNALTNLRTLCIGCHAIETSRYARERAVRRRAAKASLFQGGTA